MAMPARCIVVRASASQSLDLGSITLSTHDKDLQIAFTNLLLGPWHQEKCGAMKYKPYIV